MSAALRVAALDHPFARYVAFAIGTTALNLLAQEATLRTLPGAPLMLSILVGTGVGFVAKYLLDKHFVFSDATAGGVAETRKVALYGLFSVGTTLLFWATEFSFHMAFRTDFAKYVGAVLGLAAGYALKYQLDRRFVFREARP